EFVHARAQGPVGVLHQPVGEQQDRVPRPQRVRVVGPRHRFVDAQRQAGVGVQVAGAAVGGDDQRRQVARGGPVQVPAVPVGLDAGEAGGGDRCLGDGVQGVVEAVQDQAGRGAVVVEQGAQHVADLRHGRGGLQVVADDVTDDDRAAVVREQQGVVPVPAQVVAGGGGGAVDGGRLEGGEVGQAGQQQPLELLGGGAGLLEQAGVLDGDARGAGQRRHDGLVLL